MRYQNVTKQYCFNVSNAFIYVTRRSYLNYCILAWGYEHKRISKFRKKLSNSLKFKHLFELNIIKCYYKLFLFKKNHSTKL